jgi:hypothetical protein
LADFAWKISLAEFLGEFCRAYFHSSISYVLSRFLHGPNLACAGLLESNSRAAAMVTVRLGGEKDKIGAAGFNQVRQLVDENNGTSIEGIYNAATLEIESAENFWHYTKTTASN